MLCVQIEGLKQSCRNLLSEIQTALEKIALELQAITNPAWWHHFLSSPPLPNPDDRSVVDSDSVCVCV